MSLRVTIPNFKTRGGLNSREHHMARARRVRSERALVGWSLAGELHPALPCVVTLTRIAPSTGLDEFDNLPSSLKGCVDAIAEWLGVDDKHPSVKYQARQERGPWAVRIEIKSEAV